MTGFSEVIGSWKIIEISLPRISRISGSLSCTRSRPSTLIEPLTMRPGGFGTRRSSDSAVIVLPQPLSPTIAKVSARRIENDTSSTALTTPRRVNRYVWSPSTSSTVSALWPGWFSGA